MDSAILPPSGHFSELQSGKKPTKPIISILLCCCLFLIYLNLCEGQNYALTHKMLLVISPSSSTSRIFKFKFFIFLFLKHKMLNKGALLHSKLTPETHTRRMWNELYLLQFQFQMQPLNGLDTTTNVTSWYHLCSVLSSPPGSMRWFSSLAWRMRSASRRSTITSCAYPATGTPLRSPWSSLEHKVLAYHLFLSRCCFLQSQNLIYSSFLLCT